jgi:hypothetical protein
VKGVAEPFCIVMRFSSRRQQTPHPTNPHAERHDVMKTRVNAYFEERFMEAVDGTVDAPHSLRFLQCLLSGHRLRGLDDPPFYPRVV